MIRRMKDLVILGAGGFGRETAWLVEEINRVMPVWNLLGFIDNNAELQGKDINGLSVLGSDAWLASRRDVYAVCGFSDPLGKKNIVCSSVVQRAQMRLRRRLNLRKLIQVVAQS